MHRRGENGVPWVIGAGSDQLKLIMTGCLQWPSPDLIEDFSDESTMGLSYLPGYRPVDSFSPLESFQSLITTTKPPSLHLKIPVNSSVRENSLAGVFLPGNSDPLPPTTTGSLCCILWHVRSQLIGVFMSFKCCLYMGLPPG